MAFLAAAGPYIGTILSAAAALAQGEAAGNAAAFKAKQDVIAGNQAAGASERQAFQERRQGALILSRAIAVASGSGAGAGDPTVVDITGRIGAQTDYNAMTALYEGQQARQDYNTQAQETKWEGQQAKTAGYLEAGGQLLSGASSLYDKYGMGGFKRAPSNVYLSPGTSYSASTMYG